MKVVEGCEGKEWRRGSFVGLEKKGFVGLERERRWVVVVVWREREEREERVAEAVAMGDFFGLESE